MPRNRNSGTAVVINAAVETVIATLQGLTTKTGDAVDLEGVAQITTGTGTTALALQIRRGTTTAGVAVGSAFQLTAVAGNLYVVTCQVTDNPPESQGLAYVLTASQTGATANGTANFCTLNALWGI